MAKKSGVNKSAEIRAILDKNPKTPAKEIVAALSDKGIKVSQNLIYFIKAKMGARRRKARRQKAVATARISGGSDPVQLVLKVRELATQAGGIRNLKKLVDVLAE